MACVGCGFCGRGAGRSLDRWRDLRPVSFDAGRARRIPRPAAPRPRPRRRWRSRARRRRPRARRPAQPRVSRSGVSRAMRRRSARERAQVAGQPSVQRRARRGDRSPLQVPARAVREARVAALGEDDHPPALVSAAAADGHPYPVPGLAARRRQAPSSALDQLDRELVARHVRAGLRSADGHRLEVLRDRRRGRQGGQPSGKYDDQMGAAHPGSFPGSHRNYKRWGAPVP